MFRVCAEVGKEPQGGGAEKWIYGDEGIGDC